MVDFQGDIKIETNIKSVTFQIYYFAEYASQGD